MKKPAHKPLRSKYDINKPECQSERENLATTKEDFFQPDNLEWITSLRPLARESHRSSAGGAVGSYKKGKGGNDTLDENESQNNRNDMVFENPPGFYEDDLKKWSEKFATAKKQRV